jgi:hypothetical protein
MTGLANTQTISTSPRESAPGPGTAARRRASQALVVLVAAAAALLLAGKASAASFVTGCFTYQGAGVPGLGTVLEYQTQYGTWAYLGTPHKTDSSGCVGYTIGTQNLRIRIRAGAPLGDGRTIATAVSVYYASPGNGSYFLGRAPLGFFTLPTPWWDVTGTWMSSMDNPNCYANAALLVACHMRNNQMYANPISFYDSDRDGVWDLADRYPSDSRYR